MPESTRHLLMWMVFAVTYAGIAFGRLPVVALDRTGIALLGGVAMLLIGGLGLEQAFSPQVVDYQTLLLLFALMIFSAQLRMTGFYDWAGRFIRWMTDRPRLLLAMVVMISGGLSAILANDIVCLAFTPMLCIALLRAGHDPIPCLLALAMGANIGSAATLIGNPQNMYIGSVANLPFADYFLRVAPVTLAAMILCWGIIVLGMKGRLGARVQAAPPRDSHQDFVPVQPWRIGKTLMLLGAVVIAFLFAPADWRALAAMAGAGVLLCSRKTETAKIYQQIDWNLILLFLGLFIVNGAMANQRLTDELFAAVKWAGVRLARPIDLAGTTLVLSNLISNVPAVLLLKPAIAMDDRQSWYLLALVSTWAGNLTLVGSIANLIVAEQAHRFDVRLDLKTYCAVGIPVTLATVLLGTAWLMWVM